MGTLGINPHGPVTEDIEFNWHKRASPYILSRLKAEAEFLKCCRERGLPGVALRVANTYGPQDYQPTPSARLLPHLSRRPRRPPLPSAPPAVSTPRLSTPRGPAPHP